MSLLRGIDIRIMLFVEIGTREIGPNGAALSRQNAGGK
jgi:hypothetical protein